MKSASTPIPGITRLKNTLRQAPDVILIGEIRDAETMEHAVAFAETGHLCLGTLHANSANQTIDRIINFFPEERRNQLLMDLSSNLRAIVIAASHQARSMARAARRPSKSSSIRRASAEKIFKGEFHEIKQIMAKSRELGMRTFDWALFDLYNDGHIPYEEAIRNADSANELRLNIKLKSARVASPHRPLACHRCRCTRIRQKKQIEDMREPRSCVPSMDKKRAPGTARARSPDG